MLNHSILTLRRERHFCPPYVRILCKTARKRNISTFSIFGENRRPSGLRAMVYNVAECRVVTEQKEVNGRLTGHQQRSDSTQKSQESMALCTRYSYKAGVEQGPKPIWAG